MEKLKEKTEKKKTNNTKVLVSFLRGSKRFFIISIIASLFVTVCEMIIPQIIRATVDSVIGTEALDMPAVVLEFIEGVGGVAYFRENLYIIAVAVTAIALISAGCKYLNQYYNRLGAETMVKKMRCDLFGHIQKLPFSWHMKNQTGDIIQRCTSDVDTVKNFVSEQLISVIRIIILLVLSLFFMFSMNLTLTIVAAVSIPVIVTYSMIFHKQIGKQFTECDNNEGVLSTIVQENLTGVRVVRAFGREKYEADKFDKQNEKYTNLWIRFGKLVSLFWGCGDILTGIQVLSVIVLGTLFCVGGTMTAGEFIAFMTYNTMLIWPVRMLGRVIANMSKAGVSIDRTAQILKAGVETDSPEATVPDREVFHGDIVFDNVTFGYEGTNAPVVNKVSFTVKGGKTFAILGKTGSGKSTLMLLLDRLYELPENGEDGHITIGGIDITKIKAEALRQNIGIVLQEPYLFSRTVEENIGITQKERRKEPIRKAAETACIGETIDGFTKGYDTMIGERGVTLSGGQKQRVAIAQMLLKDAPIMIFDDSLSAVDAETDIKIRAELKKQESDATVILISHRITTLMQADTILVLDNGRVADIGTHEELLSREGVYREIYEIQKGGKEE